MRVLIGLAAVAAAGAVQAQAVPPPATPPAPPRPMSYGPPITLAQAKVAMAAAEAKARALGFDGAVISIVQPDGNLVFFEKMDNSTYVSVQLATVKARTAALARRPSGPGRSGLPLLPDLTVMTGGLPLVVDGRVVGAVGVSGADFPTPASGAAPAESGDMVVAGAAVTALK